MPKLPPNIRTGDPEKFGPAMEALNDRQRNFVMLVVHEGLDPKLAAAKAGYAINGQPATRLAHDERVQAAMLEEGRRCIRVGAMAASRYLMALISDNEVEHKDRIKAAGMILDRGGLHAMSEHQVTVTNKPSREEMLLRLAELAKSNGEDPKEVLGTLIDLLPSDFKVLDADKEDVDVSGYI